MFIRSIPELRETVQEVLAHQPITDIHTHLYSPNMGNLLLWGVDELLTYHYLVAEVMRWSDISPHEFYSWPKQHQADYIWQVLFLNHSPLSEAQRGVLTTLQGLGFDLEDRDLNKYRAALTQSTAIEHVERVLRLAHIDHIVMTNDPFDSLERAFWQAGGKPNPRFHAALRIDPLVRAYGQAVPQLRALGYDVDDDAGERSIEGVRRFLHDWIARMNPLYMAASLPPTFRFPDYTPEATILRRCVLPACREAGIPFAMMIGAERLVNPALGPAGDGVGWADLSSVAYLAREYPDTKFLVTALSRENQHELIVLARKFRNVMVFGCWWFLNNPVIIDEMTRMRVEMLGLSFIPQHSDARVLDQLIYKWAHFKAILSDVLVDQYTALLQAGWRLERAEIERDVADLLCNNFWRFVGKSV
ncbi:MAG: glucuronate isomerase [Anaerolineae bacterium]|nr:hypothetical protein [Thermoflexales bacterium]MDW8407307.1 glucuronate isomerase [Anaerolineae bacterium]